MPQSDPGTSTDICADSCADSCADASPTAAAGFRLPRYLPVMPRVGRCGVLLPLVGELPVHAGPLLRHLRLRLPGFGAELRVLGWAGVLLPIIRALRLHDGELLQQLQSVGGKIGGCNSMQ